MNATTKFRKNRSYFIFWIEFKRQYQSHLISIFFETTILWFLAMLTLFINTDNFSERFMGTVTALLVLSTMLSSIRDDLPKSAEFKFIDLWFLYHIVLIFLVCVYHVLINFGITRFRKVSERINYIVGMIALPFITFLFWVIYFGLNTSA